MGGMGLRYSDSPDALQHDINILMEFYPDILLEAII